MSGPCVVPAGLASPWQRCVLGTLGCISAHVVEQAIVELRTKAETQDAVTCMWCDSPVMAGRGICQAHYDATPEGHAAQLAALTAKVAALEAEREGLCGMVETLLQNDGIEAPESDGDEGLWILGFMVGKAMYDGIAPPGILKELTDESRAKIASARALVRRVRGGR